MPRKGYYSPTLRRDLVKRLYYAAKDLRGPMTVLNDRLMEDSLNRICEEAPTIVPIPSCERRNSRCSDEWWHL